MQIRDIDPTTEEGELVEKIANKVKGEISNIMVKVMRITRGGMKFVVVVMDENLAVEFKKSPAIKIGWTIAKAKIIPKVITCYKCHGFGHMAGKCNRGPDGKDTCRRCGSEEHKMGDCREEPKCSLCLAAGGTGTAVAHVAGSIRCPAYREEINQMEGNRKPR